MNLLDYRAAQRRDLRDIGGAPYFQDADLDDFHARALREFARFRPLLKPMVIPFVAGQDTIALQTDFQEIHRPSFEAALDIQGAYNPVQTNYGLVYQNAESGRAPMAGFETDFSGRWLPYDPWSQATPDDAVYTFLPGNPATLIVRPAPSMDASHPIFYFASYQLPTESAPGSVSDADSDLILAWACHLACEAILSDPDMLGNFKVGDREVKRDEFARGLAAKSERKRDQFEKLTRFRPIGSMG